MPISGNDSALAALQALALLAGVAGAILNAKLRVTGFYWWLVSNVVLTVLALLHGLHGVALLQLFYAGTCLFGIYQWKRAIGPLDQVEGNNNQAQPVQQENATKWPIPEPTSSLSRR